MRGAYFTVPVGRLIAHFAARLRPGYGTPLINSGPEGTVCSNGECVLECEEDDILCADGAILVCSEGAWQIKSECDTRQCKNNKDCSECSNGDESCTNDSHEKGLYKQCASGKNFEFHCKDSKDQPVSCNDNRCGGCLNGSKKCENDIAYVCENGVWSEDEACKYGCILGGNTCSEESECKTGTFRCEDDKVQICSEGQWGPETPCVNGERSCSGSTLTKCENGQWNSIKCYYDICKDDGTDCVNDPPQCKPGQTSCSNSIKQKCSDGHWSSNGSCPNGYSCAGSSCGECKNNTKRCYNNVIQTCTNGKWGGAQSCQYGCSSATNACN